MTHVVLSLLVWLKVNREDSSRMGMVSVKVVEGRHGTEAPACSLILASQVGTVIFLSPSHASAMSVSSMPCFFSWFLLLYARSTCSNVPIYIISLIFVDDIAI
uniref:Uncharacterized protein n=1 Tax=Arundo donax TaxID=35708 RepID=A0A0A8XXW9_ARUDO